MTVSKGQTKQMAEILGNLSVAWITTGIIAPVFVSTNFSTKFVGSALISIAAGGIFAVISILLIGRTES